MNETAVIRFVYGRFHSAESWVDERAQATGGFDGQVMTVTQKKHDFIKVLRDVIRDLSQAEIKRGCPPDDVLNQPIESLDEEQFKHIVFCPSCSGKIKSMRLGTVGGDLIEMQDREALVAKIMKRYDRAQFLEGISTYFNSLIKSELPAALGLASAGARTGVSPVASDRRSSLDLQFINLSPISIDASVLAINYRQKGSERLLALEGLPLESTDHVAYLFIVAEDELKSLMGDQVLGDLEAVLTGVFNEGAHLQLNPQTTFALPTTTRLIGDRIDCAWVVDRTVQGALMKQTNICAAVML